MNKKHVKFAVKLFFTLILLIIGLVSLLYGLFGKNYYTITYNEDKMINYKVYLKENKYFEKEYLEENRTYIASLIDYVDINFKYTINFDKPVSGNYKYHLKASLYANKSNNQSGYYWYKDYNLTDEEVVELNDAQSFLIDRNVKIDYGKYNSILNEFKNDYSMQMEGQLKVTLVVECTAKGKEYTKEINLSSDQNLSIPLLQHAVEMSIEKDAISNSKTLFMENDEKHNLYAIIKIVGIIITMISIIILIMLIVSMIRRNNKNVYKMKLKKILNNHDSIIANVNTLPNLEDFNVIEVSSFDELLDVYNEIRMPINYYQNKNVESIFMIINDGVIWKYTLNKSKVENN